MPDGISSAALVGGTGLVGSHILTTLTSLSSNPIVHAIARRDLPTSSVNLHPLIEPDTSKWSSKLQSLSPVPDIFFSGLGTTRALAGSFEAQKKIDYDLNLSLAKAAKESGVKTYVLISVAAASTKSLFPYSKMKAELDEAVKELGFPHTILVKPGLLLGTRKESRGPEAVLQAIAKGLGAINKKWLADSWAQDADVIGRAAVAAAMQCAEGKKEEGVWVIDQGDIIKMGETEWKGKS